MHKTAPLYVNHGTHWERYIAMYEGLVLAAREINSEIHVKPLVREASPDTRERLTVQIDLPDVTFGKNTYRDNYATIRLTHPTSVIVSLYGDRHPHVYEREFCWAEGLNVSNAIRKENWHMALMILLGVVNTYRPEDAHRRPSGSILCSREGCENAGVQPDPLRSEESVRESSLAYHYEYVCEGHSRLCFAGNCKNEATTELGYQSYSCDEHHNCVCPICNAETVLNKCHYRFTYSSENRGYMAEVQGCKDCLARCQSCNHVATRNEMHKHYSSSSRTISEARNYICPSCYRTEWHYAIGRMQRNCNAKEILSWRESTRKINRNTSLLHSQVPEDSSNPF